MLEFWSGNADGRREAARQPPGSTTTAMPKIRTTRTKKPPEGFEDIEGVRIASWVLVQWTLTHARSFGTDPR